MPSPAGAARRSTQPAGASDKSGEKGCGGRDPGPRRVGRSPIRSAPPGAGPSGAGETAAGHPTPGEQAAAAAWRPMEPLIEATPDILLRGWGSGAGQAGAERAMLRGRFASQLLEGPGLGALGPSAASACPSKNGVLGR